MEGRDILKWYWHERRLVVLIVAAAVFVSLLWQVSQPVRYRANLLINVGRQGSPASSQTETNIDEYTYDSFYRLQADERFGDTVVRWLQSPRVVSDIFKESGLPTGLLSESDLKRAISARRLSSQVIEVSFTSTDKSILEREAAAIVRVLNSYAAALNQDRPTQGWFVLVGSAPVLLDARVSWSKAAGMGFLFGAFVAVWVVALSTPSRLPMVGKKGAVPKSSEPIDPEDMRL